MIKAVIEVLMALMTGAAIRDDAKGVRARQRALLLIIAAACLFIGWAALSR